MRTDCLFCRIAAGEVSAHIIHETDMIVAFLDNAPIREGHVQIIPRRHVETFEHLNTEEAMAILSCAQRVARAQKALFGVPRVAFLFTGSDIPHAHAHLVPMVEKTDITSTAYIANADLSFRPAERQSDRALAEVAQRLRAAVSAD